MQIGKKPVQIYKHRKGRQRRYRLWPGLVVLILVAIVLIYQKGPLRGSVFMPPTEGQTGEQTTVVESDLSPATTETAANNPESTPEPTPIPAIEVELAGVGDIILHDSVIEGGITGHEDVQKYDYTPIFKYIKPIVREMDLAMFNFEGTLAGPPYTGFPFFSAPDEIADALIDTGFSVAWTANNHILDKKLDGLIRTTEVLGNKGLQVIGTRTDENKSTSAIVDVKGIKIGLLAYTFETVGTDGAQGLIRGLNGIPMPEAALPLLDSFNPYRAEVFTNDLDVILQHVARIREEGAEIVCLSLHWGEEYQTEPRAYQRQMAGILVNGGVDIIFGHHPHVLQPIEVIESGDTGKTAVVFYSTGNLLANMLYTTHGTEGKAQDAIIARITLVKDETGLHIEKAGYIPTYILRVPRDQGFRHLVVPVLQALEDPAAFQTSYADMQASLERIERILGVDREDLLPVNQLKH